MAITCPRCGSEFDVTLFQFGHGVRCRCGAEVEYPGTGLRAGHVASQGENKVVAHEDRHVGGMRATSGQPQPDSERLFRIARAAGEQLVADLDRARQFTGQWADRKLAEVLTDAALTASLHRLAESGCWGEANRLPSQEFWRVAGSLLELGSLQRHARLKPRGYAGDYQMLHWIWTDYSCDHSLGRAFDRYFQRQAAPQAVRSRTQQTAAALVAHCLQADGPSYHVVSVGSGPATDISQALAVLPENRRTSLQATLLDLDPEALEFSQPQVTPLLGPGALRCLRENLFRLPKNPNRENLLGTPDFLICSGLFDYLPDEAATAMLRLFWDHLAEGGVLMVGNFAPHNPTRAYMEWIGNWYLTYRTSSDLERLAEGAGISPGRFSVGTEALGVDFLLIARK
jgi:hypothetical protein